MPFIKIQKLVRRADNTIQSGSAAIVDVSYVKQGVFHSKQTVRERLGKVLFIAENKRSGIFLSPTRGVVFYDADSDAFTSATPEDPRVKAGTEMFEPPVHKVFGDAHLLLSHMKMTGFVALLHSVIQDQKMFSHLLGHVIYSVLRDGCRIPCEVFLGKSVALSLLSDISASQLSLDMPYYHALGNADVKRAFFSGFAAQRIVKLSDLKLETVQFDFCKHSVVAYLDKSTGTPFWFETTKNGESPEVASEVPSELAKALSKATAASDQFDAIQREFLSEEHLPESYWTEDSVQGMLLHNAIAYIVFRSLEISLAMTGNSISESIGRLQSLMCLKTGYKLKIETPSPEVRKIYARANLQVPTDLDLSIWKANLE